MSKAVDRLYKILFSCIRKNNNCSTYLLNVENCYLEFFLKQLNYYRQSVQKLLKEAVRFMESEDEKEEQNLSKWMQLLETITIENIED